MEDIEILRTGACVILPSDDHCGVLYVRDDSRFDRPPGDTYFRIPYYMATIYNDKESLKKGAHILYVVSGEPTPEPCLDRTNTELVLAGLPVKVKERTIAQTFQDGKQEYLDFLGYKTSRIVNFLTGEHPQLLAPNSCAGTLKMLEEHGFKRDNLPRCLGGLYDHKVHFRDWIRKRISVEDIISSTPLIANRWSTSPQPGSLTPKRRKKDSDEKPSAEEERQKSALRSRRSFHRQQLETLRLSELARVLEMRNDSVRISNIELESLLTRAEACVSHLRKCKSRGSGETQDSA